jgi:hypothetical protein
MQMGWSIATAEDWELMFDPDIPMFDPTCTIPMFGPYPSYFEQRQSLICMKTCDPGNYFDANFAYCVTCPTECATCITATRCFSCRNDYYLWNEACLTC